MFVTKCLWITIDYHSIKGKKTYGSQCCPTVWVQTFFKTSWFIFSRRKKSIQVWNNLRVSKWSLHLWANYPLNCASLLVKMFKFHLFLDSTSLFDVIFTPGRCIFKSVCSSAIRLWDVSCQMSNRCLEDVSLTCILNHYILETFSKHLFDIWQEMSYRLIADKQTLLKIHLPDVKKITSNRLVLSRGNGQSCSDMSGPSVHSIELQWLEINESIIFGIESHTKQSSTASCIHDSHFLLSNSNSSFFFC